MTAKIVTEIIKNPGIPTLGVVKDGLGRILYKVDCPVGRQEIIEVYDDGTQREIRQKGKALPTLKAGETFTPMTRAELQAASIYRPPPKVPPIDEAAEIDKITDYVKLRAYLKRIRGVS